MEATGLTTLRRERAGGAGLPSAAGGWHVFGLALCLFAPSLDQVQKYLGLKGVAVYAAAGSLALVAINRHALPAMSALTERGAAVLLAVTLLCLAAAFALAYPLAQSGGAGGGSDQDDALNVAAAELLHGRYPYYQTTYLGGQIAPLPGSIFLALPFVLLGNSAYQNFFWLAVFFFAARSYLKDGRAALLLLWAVLALSPGVMQQILTGGDHPANAVAVLCAVLWTVAQVTQADSGAWAKSLSAVFLGVAVTTRANFMLVLPLVFARLLARAGWRPALGYAALTCLTVAALIAPFYLYDPGAFAPLAVQAGKLAQFEGVLPHAGVVITAASALLAAALSFRSAGQDERVLLRNCALTQALPVACAVALSMAQSGRPDFALAGYGVHFLFFGALACHRRRAAA